MGRPIPFTVVTKPNGAACNLDCEYCYFLSKEMLYGHVKQQMSLEVAKRYVDTMIAEHPDREIPLVWQGGEPTMRGLDFFREIVAYAASRADGRTITHAIQTNGTLINDEWASFLRENNFLVGISMDGPATLHDTYRTNRAGRGTLKQVVRGWEILQKHQVETNILCTVNRANQDHGLEVYEFFVDELGAQYLQFIPIVERVTTEVAEIAEHGWKDDAGDRVLYTQTGSQVTSRSVQAEAWGNFLCQIFDRWVTRDVGTVFVQHFDTMFAKFFGQESVCVHAPTCGLALAMEYNGDIYACDHYVEPDYLLGNVTDSSFQNLLASDFQRRFGNEKARLPHTCKSCKVRRFCAGGCPKDRFVDVGNGPAGPNLNYLCAGYYRFFTHAYPDMVAMARLLRAGRAPAEICAPEVRFRLRPAGR